MSFVVPSHWRSKPSPNKSRRLQRVTAIVLHADASAKVESTLDWITRGASQVSYHVVVSRMGAIFCCVNPDEKAWHAGVSKLDHETNCNEFSVGVCLSNKNDGVEPYPQVQVSATADVCALLCRVYGIPVDRITTHAIVSPGRKTDPKGLDLEAFRESVRARLKL